MLIIQYIFIAFISFTVFAVIRQARNVSLKIGQILFWLTLWISSIIIILFPEVTVVLSKSIGITRGTDLIIYSSIILLYYLLFKLVISTEKTNRKLKELNTKLSIEISELKLMHIKKKTDE